MDGWMDGVTVIRGGGRGGVGGGVVVEWFAFGLVAVVT